jgi:hypothetical protein
MRPAYLLAAPGLPNKARKMRIPAQPSVELPVLTSTRLAMSLHSHLVIASPDYDHRSFSTRAPLESQSVPSMTGRVIELNVVLSAERIAIIRVKVGLGRSAGGDVAGNCRFLRQPTDF